MRHIVWDWNGTLFDDLHIVVDSVNVSLAHLGEAPIDADGYRAHYRRPVPRFYESLLGRPIPDDTWQSIDQIFHQHYHDALGAAGLTSDARRAVDAVSAAGGTQSILSMWWHDRLVPAVRAFGLEEAMALVDGHRGLPGESKASHLVAHLATLERSGVSARSSVVAIGDIVDDAEAAAAAGVGCVLYDGGSQPADLLATAGVPVAATLVEAVRLAGLGA